MPESKEIVVCDIKHCLNCGNCIIACQRRHKDISRHVREGSALIGISLIPNLCKICRDPKCIAACKRQALERNEEGSIVVKDTCVGCGLCVRSCPYNAILIFSDQEREPSLFEKLNKLINPKKEELPEDGKPVKKKRKRIAVKCDGCAGYDNRACVYNCPTGALKVMTIRQFLLKHKESFNIELRELLRAALEEKVEEVKNGQTKN